VDLYYFPKKYTDTFLLLLKKQQKRVEGTVRPEKEGQQ
jgi:hypothetical protein